MFEKNYIQEKRKLESDIKKWKKEKQLLIVKNALKEDKKKIKQQYKKEKQKLTIMNLNQKRYLNNN